MPKLKTKSSAKKRFKVTGRGKITAFSAYKRHNLVGRTKKMKRANRQANVLSAPDQKIVRKWMPYDR